MSGSRIWKAAIDSLFSSNGLVDASSSVPETATFRLVENSVWSFVAFLPTYVCHRPKSAGSGASPTSVHSSMLEKTMTFWFPVSTTEKIYLIYCFFFVHIFLTILLKADRFILS